MAAEPDLALGASGDVAGHGLALMDGDEGHHRVMARNRLRLDADSVDAPEDVIARQRDAAALAAGDLTAEVIRQGVVEVNPRWSDRVETWVQLTADELYADYCNHGDGPRVLARALRLGYQRGVEDRSQSVVASDAWDAKSRAD